MSKVKEWRLKMTASRARPLVEIALGFAAALGVGVATRALTEPATSAAFAGAFLQVLGLSTVAAGLHGLRQKFRRPGVVAQAYAAARERIARLLSKPRNVVLHAEAGEYVLVGEDVEAIVRAGPATPIDRRVEILEGELDRLRERVGRDRERVARLDDAVTRERTERTTADAALGGTVEELAAGGLNLQTMGLCWLFGGALLGTLPGPIAAALCRLLGGC